MSRLTETSVERNSAEDLMSTWVSQGSFFLETRSGLALVWSHGLNAHLQLEHIFQFTSI